MDMNGWMHRCGWMDVGYKWIDSYRWMIVMDG